MVASLKRRARTIPFKSPFTNVTSALSIAISVTGYYLTRFIWDVITHKVLYPKPVILLPDTKIGRIDRLKRWWNGYTTPAMIFDAVVSDDGNIGYSLEGIV